VLHAVGADARTRADAKNGTAGGCP